MNIKNLPELERPVEKLLFQGKSELSNSEILAILLGSGLRDKSAISLAEEIMAKSEQGISYLWESSPEELMEIPGVGKKKAARLMAAVELGKRLSKVSVKPNLVVTSSEEIARIFIDELRFEKQEYLKVLMLNSQGGIISVKTITIGTVQASLIHPREVFKEAIKRSSTAIALIHNHPSGNPEPSEHDIEMTEIIKDSGEILGIPLIDHIIVGDKGYYSFKDRGQI